TCQTILIPGNSRISTEPYLLYLRLTQDVIFNWCSKASITVQSSGGHQIADSTEMAVNEGMWVVGVDVIPAVTGSSSMNT
ncbi:MAG: hypothetical protein KFF73_13835, partial [Cyclobacteriaceae bacterium]|nr:hypothetical protein [Cyclobacteriaceae bacterium]